MLTRHKARHHTRRVLFATTLVASRLTRDCPCRRHPHRPRPHRPRPHRPRPHRPRIRRVILYNFPLCIPLESHANHVTKLAIILVTSYSPPHSSHRVLLAIVLAAGILIDLVLIDLVLIDLVFVASYCTNFPRSLWRAMLTMSQS